MRAHPVRLVQSIGGKQNIHAALDKPHDRALCGYRIGRSWLDHGRRWLEPPSYPRVSCKRCRRVLGVLEPASVKLRCAVRQLGEVVALAMERGTFAHLAAPPSGREP